MRALSLCRCLSLSSAPCTPPLLSADIQGCSISALHLCTTQVQASGFGLWGSGFGEKRERFASCPDVRLRSACHARTHTCSLAYPFSSPARARARGMSVSPPPTSPPPRNLSANASARWEYSVLTAMLGDGTMLPVQIAVELHWYTGGVGGPIWGNRSGSARRLAPPHLSQSLRLHSIRNAPTAHCSRLLAVYRLGSQRPLHASLLAFLFVSIGVLARRNSPWYPFVDSCLVCVWGGAWFVCV